MLIFSFFKTAIIVHFAFLSTFTWLNVMSFDIWWTFRYFPYVFCLFLRAKHVISACVHTCFLRVGVSFVIYYFSYRFLRNFYIRANAGHVRIIGIKRENESADYALYCFVIIC